jgi:hypothetical protein
MSHARQDIRDNIVTTLTGLSITGSNVYKTRVYPLANNKLPGLCIYTGSETSEAVTLTRPRTKLRVLEVFVEAYATATADLDDALDDICVEVEEALALDVTRGGKAKDTVVTATEMEFSGEGDKPVGVARMTVTVTYMTTENNVETAV